MGKRQMKWLRKKWDELMLLYGGKCNECGSINNLQFAHVRKTKLNGSSRGKWKRYYDIINNLDCYRLKCAECHNSFDEYKKLIDEPEYWGNPY